MGVRERKVSGVRINEVSGVRCQVSGVRIRYLMYRVSVLSTGARPYRSLRESMMFRVKD